MVSARNSIRISIKFLVRIRIRISIRIVWKSSFYMLSFAFAVTRIIEFRS